MQLSDRIVVKIRPSRPTVDVDMTAYIRSQTSDIPVPEPLGILAFDGRLCQFMSLVEGCSADKLWPDLSESEKCSFRDQLGVLLEKLRMLPLLSKYLGGGNPPKCVDTRMSQRESPECMETEAQFNEFLLADNKRPTLRLYADFIRLMLRTDHRIVLTR